MPRVDHHYIYRERGYLPERLQFILMAKEQGLKFTFGSDSRNQQAGRLDYCKYIAKKCKLKRDDFYIPKRSLNRT
jgi:histidinol phosphatase-like PHP family hydrolase